MDKFSKRVLIVLSLYILVAICSVAYLFAGHEQNQFDDVKRHLLKNEGCISVEHCIGAP